MSKVFLALAQKAHESEVAAQWCGRDACTDAVGEIVGHIAAVHTACFTRNRRGAVFWQIQYEQSRIRLDAGLPDAEPVDSCSELIELTRTMPRGLSRASAECDLSSPEELMDSLLDAASPIKDIIGETVSWSLIRRPNLSQSQVSKIAM